jgi:hypothetical protein
MNGVEPSGLRGGGNNRSTDVNEKIMDLAAAKSFAETWHANWCRVDIDAVVSHFAKDAEMRSPLTEKLTGSPIVKGAEEIRQYSKKGLRPREKRRSSIAVVELGQTNAPSHGVVASG